MEIKNRRIIETVKTLGLPEGEYAVFGSGILDVLSIRNSDDIDIITTKALYEKLKNSGGWSEFSYPNGDLALKYNDDSDAVSAAWYYCEIAPCCSESGVRDMIVSSMSFEGVSFVSLEDTIKWKNAFGREKDIQDVKLIREFIKRRENGVIVS